ncbi:MAG: hypothetical protein LBO06_05375 [Bacteroidales bacterium]|jgi:hypothetical protein|nr:hypothetical protein [Bacteroidales bacterium]
MRKRIVVLSALILTSINVFGQIEGKEKGNELMQFISDLRQDYKDTPSQLQYFSDIGLCSPYPTEDSLFSKWAEDNTQIIKDKKRQCYQLVLTWLYQQGRNAVLAPFCYTIWWWNKERITNKVYDKMYPLASETDSLPANDVFLWLNEQIETGTFKTACEKELKSIGNFWYFIWTFSDIEDPLGRGGLPNDYKGGNNTFGNRFLYSAVRNPGGLRMHIYQRSGIITNQITTIDTRTDEQAKSYGIGNQKLGTWLCWYVDENDKLYFIYERATQKKIFYCGFVRTYSNNKEGVTIEQNRKRFEVSLRKNKNNK